MKTGAIAFKDLPVGAVFSFITAATRFVKTGHNKTVRLLSALDEPSHMRENNLSLPVHRTGMTQSDAVKFIQYLHRSDKLYHFDDSAKDIVEVKTGRRTFTDKQARVIDMIVANMFNINHFCPFEVALGLININKEA